jgi:carbohydrate ABC transporter membrane protein 2, CUT1 family (TC 3.A.1.1.-)
VALWWWVLCSVCCLWSCSSSVSSATGRPASPLVRSRA